MNRFYNEEQENQLKVKELRPDSKPASSKKEWAGVFSEYRSVLEFIGAISAIFFLLVISKITGLYDWWIQLVRQFV